MTDDEVDSIARYLAHEVDSVPIFDDDATDATTGFPTLDSAREHYRGHARAILRTVRSLGWVEPERLAGKSPVMPPVPLSQWGIPGLTEEEITRLKAG